MDFLAAFDRALKTLAESLDMETESVVLKGKIFYHVGLEGAFGEFHVTPRSLTTKYISKLISIEGIITTCEPGFPPSFLTKFTCGFVRFVGSSEIGKKCSLCGEKGHFCYA